MIKKGIIVGININNKNNFDESMEELKNLCLACQIETVGQIKQNSKKVNSTFYMGSGKIDELKKLVEENNADIVIFNNELSASQVKNIEEEINCNVIDRTALILDIFANRAKTRESKLQVEVAKLQYELPRLVGSNEDLGRQSGGVGTKNRGAGETKLELDRRRIEDKIANLNKELEVLKNQREVQKSKRKKSNIPNVALVGYTNAGKSSVMNALVEKFINDEDKKVFEKNMLFATLETYVRNIKLDNNKSFLLSDTVGFVAGFVDAVAGGGGLITLPAYIIAGFPVHNAIATNKMSSSMGSTAATIKYALNGFINWKMAPSLQHFLLHCCRVMLQRIRGIRYFGSS